MSPHILRLIKAAYGLPRHTRDMTVLQRQLYQATKRAYVQGTPEKRANLLANARAMAASKPST
jgi:hypothetical protein